MIPDNIQANIMKYLNNGVSGSSQPQKPVLLPDVYDFNNRFFNTTNTYVTEDNQYIVNIGIGWNNPTEQIRQNQIRVWDINNTIKDNPEPAMIFIVPQTYNNKELVSLGDYINRDEEGRFYTTLYYGTEQNNSPYLVIFNDFITDGIIQINEAYKLDDINVTSDTYHQMKLSRFAHVIKLKGKGEYIFFDYRQLGASQIGQWAGQYAFYVAKMIISVGEGIKTKCWKFNIKNETDDQFLGYQKMSINTDSDIPFILMQYYTTYTIDGDPSSSYRIIPTNYAVGKIYLEEDSNTDFTTTTLKNITTINDYVAVNDFSYRAYNTNGLYIQDVLKKYTNNVVSLKYIFTTSSQVAENINFPTTFNITNFNNDNISISDTFIIIGLFGDTNYKQLYKIDSLNNNIIYISDLSVLSTTLSTAEIIVLKQYNLYFCFAFTVLPKAFAIKDVPVYGRDCILKQKFLNSKFIRFIKKHRSRHTNI